MTERMPSDPPLEIDIHLFDRFACIGRILRRCVEFLPVNAPNYMSTHNTEHRGASEALDATMYNNPPKK